MSRTALLALLLAGCAAPAPAPAPRPETPAAPAASGPYALSPAAFRRLASAQRPIAPARIDHELLAAAVFHETNVRRRQHGCPALGHLPPLDEAAALHARAMRRGGFFAHENPRDRSIRTLEDRLARVGVSPVYAAENIARSFGIRYEANRRVYVIERGGGRAFSYTPDGPAIAPHSYVSFADALLDQWMDSPGHRANILSPEPEHLGTGCEHALNDLGMDEFYCVQLFAR